MNILSPPNKPFSTYHGTWNPLLSNHRNRKLPKQFLLRRSLTVQCKSNSNSSKISGASSDDFVSRVLKENPSQVQPKYLVGDKFVTLKEKENLGRKFNVGIFDVLSKRLQSLKHQKKGEGTENEAQNQALEEKDSVHLRDLLKEYRGKLYVPEQVFGPELSEEEEFNKNVQSLPRISIEDFQKAMSKDKVKSITSKGDTAQFLSSGYRDYIVELKEIPGDKRLHITKWVLKLENSEAEEILEGYTGPRYEIERHNTYWVGKIPEYPHPVASSISSRMMAELAVVTFLDLWQGIDFSRSKAEARVDGSTGVKFCDVAGIDEAVEELQELVRYLKNPELFDKMGIKPPHGVLLEGPPGCGKTLVAKAIAGEAGVPFYQMAGSEFVEVLVGVGSARIRDLFKRAKVNKPSVIFIDEIDALATRRQGIFKESSDQLYNAATQERETTLNQLLIELDGFDTGKGVIFLAATNRKDLLDPALLRPGRFDRKIRIRPPGAKGRLDILKIHASKVKMSDSVDLSSYAQNLPGWTGAKLAQLVQEAALVAVRKRHNSILQSDMDDAVDRLTVGPKRVGIELGYQGQCRRATTEVGVALTSHLLRRYENAIVECCDRISIVPRGQTLSQLVFHRLDDEAYMFEREPQLLHRLQVLLGGRAAEEVIYGRDTSKASVDYLASASWLARKILTIWNLENPMVIHGEPPPWRKSARFVGPRLDFEGSLYDDYNLIEPPLNFKLDDEVAERTEELIRKMYGKTVSLLGSHHAALLKAIKVLLNQKEISGEELDFILNNYPPQTPVRVLEEEDDPGYLPFPKEQVHDLEFALQSQSKEEAV
ncbi:probable inactive ATP-dependent zinc metalloprotease FTSHI 1, chloroplastic isoform X2 [Arachis hypogaea]|uniref:probable inactive ATP-dependent zinc metalloprotease FTSHI 1, chloroplastic isoform X2 n=1 Tax=Arachis hypogaea TaxID=3818 RepID=UPI000DEC14D5|nr:probable inactive ATP-dependent zinc metalloprotease FTSHI 1, chloroplastic isoform X2 [Arachis hypogaea]